MLSLFFSYRDLKDMVLPSNLGQISTNYSEIDCTNLLTINCSLCLNQMCNTSTLGVTTEYPPPPYSPGLTAFLGLIAALTSLATTTGNILVVLAFILERHLWQPSNYLIASLAVTDILIGMFSMPFYTLYLLRSYWPLGRTVCHLWLSLDYTVCLVSQYTVFLITLDRFCSVKAPAKYRNWRTTKKIKIMIVLIWLAPAAIFFTTIMGWNTFRGEEADDRDYTCAAQFEENPLFTAILVISYYWVTLVVMVVLYMGIYQVALSLHQKARHKRNRLKQMGHLSANNNDLQPLNGPRASRELSSARNGIGQRESTSHRGRENGGSNNSKLDAESDISNENSSDSVYSNRRQPEASRTTQTPSIIVDHTPSTHNTAAESPLWKPRPSLPNTKIYWDAFSQDTSSSLQVTETTECDDSPNSASEREQQPDEEEDGPNEVHATEKTISSIGKVFTHLGKLGFKRREKGSPRTKSKSENRARKALRTISFILGAFVVCWTPYHVTVLVAAFCGNCVNTRFYEFTYWLCYMNSPLNPFCYALSNNQFKKAFLRIIKGEYFKKSCCHKFGR